MKKNRVVDIRDWFGFILWLCCWGCAEKASPPGEQDRLFNLAHLNQLYEEVVIDGKEMAIVHVYSEYPDYRWVDASNEGIACVDDAARAAVVYLRHFEIRADQTSLQRARKLLDFCRYMQAEDGQFYNFIYADRSINRDGKTSYKSLGWWTARGMWALGEGYRVFLTQDAAYAAALEQHIKKVFPHIDTLFAHHAGIENFRGFKNPKWLLYNSAADATSELLLGLAAYAEASGNSRARAYLVHFSEGLVHMQIRDESTPFFGAHLSWRNVWHGWGNSQTQALARTCRLVESKAFRESAMQECTHFYPYWIAQGFPREIVFAHQGGTVEREEIKQFDQIAYALRPAIVGSLNLYQLTANERYAELAGELATWFFGNNPAAQKMYDPATGRCFDGILSSTEINRNSGAESTIEALYALLEVENNAIARIKLSQYLR